MFVCRACCLLIDCLCVCVAECGCVVYCVRVYVFADLCCFGVVYVDL